MKIRAVWSLFVFVPLMMFHSAWASDNETTPYVIVVTGNELLRGLYQDGHTQYITAKLSPLGTHCVASLCVGDTRKDLLDALKFGVEHAPLVIVTGGLGPTDDDITRDTISEFTGIPINEHPDVLERMARRFHTPIEDLRENLRRQTKTPVRGDYLENANGSAVGLIFDTSQTVIVSMPGPPRELQPMVANELIPYLAKRFGTYKIGRSLTMRFVGIGESNIDHAIHQNMKLPDDLIISSLFEQSRVDVTFAFPGDTGEDFQRLKALEAELMQYVGDHFYADDGSTLEMHVLRLLQEKNATISVAEIGSGGAIAASLSDAPNSQGVYFGGYVAADLDGMCKFLNRSHQDAVQIPVDKITEQFALNTCDHIGSSWAIAVSEIVEEDNGNQFVWVALGSKQDGIEMHRIGTRGRGESAQKRLVTSILQLLWNRLKS